MRKMNSLRLMFSCCACCVGSCLKILHVFPKKINKKFYVDNFSRVELWHTKSWCKRKFIANSGRCKSCKNVVERI